MPNDERPGHDWPRYYAAVDSQPPHAPLLLAADNFDSEGPRERRAVDIGCGGGRDTLELLRRGWSVIAIDVTQGALDQVRDRAGDAGERLELVHARMEEATWPVVDLVNAGFALPFCERAAFPALWSRITGSLRAGGRFSGELFGDRDDWAGEVLTHTRAEVEALFAGFAMERFEEAEREFQKASGGTKHGHIYFLVGRKL